LGNLPSRTGKDGKVCIAGAPGLIDALKIITGAEQVKDGEDYSYFKKIPVNSFLLPF